MRAFRLWQIADSAFPTGGFAHSGGLEAAWRLGAVPNVQALETWLRAALQQASCASLPLVTAAHAEVERFAELDRLAAATLTNHVARRASRTQGRAWLQAAAAFQSAGLDRLRARVRDDALDGHLAPVFGAASALLDIACNETQRLWLYLQLRGGLSSAVRLNLVGPHEAQSLQDRLGVAAEAAWRRGRRRSLAELAQTSPLHEVYQGHHDRL